PEPLIAAGRNPRGRGAAREGIPGGTRFHAQAAPLENRKRWIFGAPPAGEIPGEDGATAALLARGSALLPTGIDGGAGGGA
ncbi:glutamate 5-kinase, partial [Salmonella enterica subsp. enterica serovar Enteritidis]